MNRTKMTLLSVAALALSACTAPEPAEDARLQVADEMVQAWNDRDWERVYALFAEDGVLHSMMKEPIVGRDNIRERLAPLAAGIERIELQIRNRGMVGDAVVLERVDDFDYQGKASRVPVVGVLEITDGQVTEWREYYDYAMLASALVPDPLPEAEQIAQAEAEIRALTEQLQTDWNRGDMAAYLDAYWKDEGLSLMFGGTAMRGWEALDAMYTSTWTTEESMGDFVVRDMAITLHGPDVAIASGAFEHVFPAETVVGAFSHAWRRIDGTWVIVHEHTSRAPATP